MDDLKNYNRITPLKKPRIETHLIISKKVFIGLISSTIFCLILAIFFLNFYLNETQNNRVQYERGYEVGKSELPPPVKIRECTTEAALAWWSGTNNLATVRKNLCSNNFSKE